MKSLLSFSQWQILKTCWAQLFLLLVNNEFIHSFMCSVHWTIYKLISIIENNFSLTVIWIYSESAYAWRGTDMQLCNLDVELRSSTMNCMHASLSWTYYNCIKTTGLFIAASIRLYNLFVVCMCIPLYTACPGGLSLRLVSYIYGYSTMHALMLYNHLNHTS